ncbi:hypothetical protein CVU37_10900 [candidate division BRC1 bacterium HGW-BRC1-1]|jgi:hypothetical protein|nr:MAG: hypothetical protein CVU37_10900 [candidate division BRC1 bacterium HGW-BRC1-1]
MRRVQVKAHPKARFEKVEDDGAGGLKVWTTAAPDKGAANEVVRKMVAKHFGVSPSRVTLRLGATSRNKVFEIDD